MNPADPIYLVADDDGALLLGDGLDELGPGELGARYVVPMVGAVAISVAAVTRATITAEPFHASIRARAPYARIEAA